MRLRYGIAAMVTIALGLGSRYCAQWLPEALNLWLGDSLYAAMMYFILSAIFPEKNLRFRILVPLIICFLIELSQRYHSPAADSIRNTLLGRLVLGSGFLWSDLLAYMGGVTAAAIPDRLFLKKKA